MVDRASVQMYNLYRNQGWHADVPKYERSTDMYRFSGMIRFAEGTTDVQRREACNIMREAFGNIEKWNDEYWVLKCGSDWFGYNCHEVEILNKANEVCPMTEGQIDYVSVDQDGDGFEALRYELKHTPTFLDSMTWTQRYGWLAFDNTI